MAHNFQHSSITSKIFNAYFKVYNNLGYGFLEKVYVNSLFIELNKLQLNCKSQQSIKVYYETFEVGFYIADIIVNDCVIVEVKAAEMVREEHEVQLINYLKSTNIEVGLLLNFGKNPDVKRKVFSSEYKYNINPIIR